MPDATSQPSLTPRMRRTHWLQWLAVSIGACVASCASASSAAYLVAAIATTIDTSKPRSLGGGLFLFFLLFLGSMLLGGAVLGIASIAVQWMFRRRYGVRFRVAFGAKGRISG